MISKEWFHVQFCEDMVKGKKDIDTRRCLKITQIRGPTESEIHQIMPMCTDKTSSKMGSVAVGTIHGANTVASLLH